MQDHSLKISRLPSWLPDKWLSRMNLLWLIPFFSGGLMIAIWAVALLHIRQVNQEIKKEAIQRNESLVHAFEEHVLRTVQSVDQSVQLIKYEYESKGDSINLASYLNRGIVHGDIELQLAIIGPDGILRKSSLPNFKPVDLSFREHFKVHVKQDNGQLFISKPVKGKISGKWSLQFTRRINRPDGSFGGVVVISIDPNYFTRFYHSIDLGMGGVITLVGQDGIVRARSGDKGAGIGADLKAGKLFSYWPRVSHASFEQKSIIDGTSRFYSFRAVQGYPLAVVMGQGQDEALADAHREERTDLLQATIASIFVLGGAYLLFLLTWRLKASQLQAESANKLKSEFLAHMSHELRTPLNGILGFADYLQETLAEPHDREAAQVIHKSGQHLLRLVNTILDLARIEAGRMQLELQPEHVPTLIHNAVETFRSKAEKKGLVLDLQIVSQPGCHAFYRVDATRLTQVINNLVHNAVKFTQSGEIHVHATLAAASLRLYVKDTGPGIPSSQYEHVFERFRQAGAFLTRSHGGSGLGLALAKELMQLMGGQITFESALGIGTTFFLTLPLEEHLQNGTAQTADR